ncbi:hypothetical protein L0152_33390 [bacterium]|nr:hypothetical protein [bacterium]
MGIIRIGPPEELILLVQKHKSIAVFVETGTYFGGTAFWASKHFEKVITVENSEKLYQQAKEKYGDVGNIEFVLGDTRKELRRIVPTLASQAIFWLDSHWSGGETFGMNDECPIIVELEIIANSNCNHVLLIDDARLFASPPPIPHKLEQWPTLTELFSVIKRMYPDSYVVIFEDVVICVPSEMKALVSEFCQIQNSAFWRKYSQLQSETKWTRGIRLIREGAGLVTQSLRDTIKGMGTGREK